jgi:chromosome segregation ATPase
MVAGQSPVGVGASTLAAMADGPSRAEQIRRITDHDQKIEALADEIDGVEERLMRYSDRFEKSVDRMTSRFEDAVGQLNTELATTRKEMAANSTELRASMSSNSNKVLWAAISLLTALVVTLAAALVAIGG